MTEPRKEGVVLPLSWEQLGSFGPEWANFARKGRTVEIPLTDEDRAAHARAVSAFSELESNPWVMRGYEPDELAELRPRKTFVPEESEEEWVQRWVEAGRPVRDLMGEIAESSLKNAFNAYRLGGFWKND